MKIPVILEIDEDTWKDYLYQCIYRCISTELDVQLFMQTRVAIWMETDETEHD